MGTLRRGIKNAFRNSVRTFSITLILALSIAMSLIMLLAMKTVSAKIENVKSSIGNTITVSPAGVRGFEGGGELLTVQNATDLAGIDHVTSVTKTVTDRLNKIGAVTPSFGRNDDTSSNATTSLDSSIEAGSFGRRQRATSTGESAPANFSPPVQVSGIDNLDSAQALSALGVSKFEVTSGKKIDPNSTDNIAMVGKELATKNNLAVGSVFTAYGQDIKVSGIFDTGTAFTNAIVVMPIKTLQTLSGQTDSINSIIVTTDSIDTISSVTNSIKTKLGDKADVTSQQDSSENALKPLENIRTISLYSLIGSLVAGSIIIFLTMVMIVRERRREIGILKAIGSSNIKIVSQFVYESLVLTLLGSVVGAILGFIFSNPVLNVLVTNSQSSGENTVISTGRQMGNGPGAGGMAARFGDLSTTREALSNLHAVVGVELILYGALVAIVIAIIGSAIPAYLISKIRPAEVMRAE